jgi:NADH:ubiquinone oxidoreductase subunit F (NADH-binding)/Pyruvate/2-oxoacid:ferredoxin oxidoreductase delta subunit
MASIEGSRGTPRVRPPFPIQSGLWGYPTCINNVETLANVPNIITKGHKWYASIGTKKSKGTKIFALAGMINNTGLVEVPLGITLREIIFDVGGGIPDRNKFKAALTGGPSGGCIPPEYLDLSIDYESLAKVGAIMGSGGLIVMDDTTCVVDIAKYFMTFTQSESCGKCVPCRMGTKRMMEILTRITEGKGTIEDMDLLKETAERVKDSSLCGLGQTAPNPVITTMKYFGHEYRTHIIDKKCPALKCKSLVTYTIDAELCKKCHKCADSCSAGAISGEKKEIHKIIQAKCIKCGACVMVCPFDAVKLS